MWKRHVDWHPLGMEDARSICIDSFDGLIARAGLETVCGNGPAGSVDLSIRTMYYGQDGSYV